MSYPGNAEYAQAVRDYPHISILDPKLKSGIAKRGRNNQIVSYSGGFSIVFPIEVTSKTYALRGWLKDVGDAETRYQAISDYLTRAALPYFVDFEYVSEGILVNGNKWPITRMEWAEGETLCQFIDNNLHESRALRITASEFLKMVEILHAHQISHGDLQDGNILLKRNGPDVEIKLIDYDSVFVPALQGYPDTIVGLPEYQHPQRQSGARVANEKADYFSELVIYLSFLSLAEKPGLWRQFGQRTERALLFVVDEFRNPAQSSIFQELESLSSDVKLLASKLKQFCAKTSIDQLEPLEMLLPRTDPAAKNACDQGLIFLHSQRYNEAIAEFEKAIRIEPNFREAHHGLSLTYMQIGNLDLAKMKAEDTLKIDANYWPALQLLDTVKQILRNPPPKPPSSQQSGSGPTSHPSSLKHPTIRDFFGTVITLFQRLQHYFNRRTFISAGAVCLVAVILLVWSPWRDSEKDNGAEKTADPNGTQGATNSSNGDGQNSLTATSGGAASDDVKMTSKDGDQETTIPSSTGEDNKTDGDPPRESPVVNVSINAVPWAKVFIKLPQTKGYMKPLEIHFTIPPNASEKRSNITPIRGGLRVPADTTIMLEYGDRKKTFNYSDWKTSKAISHDFLSP